MIYVLIFLYKYTSKILYEIYETSSAIRNLILIIKLMFEIEINSDIGIFNIIKCNK